MRHLIISLLSILFLTSCVTKSEFPGNPNIVIILADDMGFGDVQALNPKSNIPTPNLNRLAEEGITFTDAQVPAANNTIWFTMTGRRLYYAE